MCRNIRPMFNFEPQATDEDASAAVERRLHAAAEALAAATGVLRVELWRVDPETTTIRGAIADIGREAWDAVANPGHAASNISDATADPEIPYNPFVSF